MDFAPLDYCWRELPLAKPSVRQATDEIDNRGADLAWTLLLGPVSAAGQNSHVTQSRDELFEIGEMLVHARGGDHQIVVACDEQRRDRHHYIGKRSHQLPIAIDVAIIVERTAEAAAPEFAGIELDISFAEPRRQRRRRSLQHASAARNHAGRSRDVAAGCGVPESRRAFARRAVEHSQHSDPWIPLHLGLSYARLLKIELVELRVRGLRHAAGRAHRPARPEWHAEAGHGAEAVRAQAGRLQGDSRASVMADDDGGWRFEGVEQPHQITDQMEDRVLIDGLRPIALAVAAHIRSDGVEAGGGQRGELMAPGIPGFRESVTQDHRQPLALPGDV